jgi:GNAT superfamily N-acetyltransferase
MEIDLTYEYLSDHHKSVISSFLCEDEIIVSDFLMKDAIKFQKTKSAITRLYFDKDQQLIGYFTLFTDLVEILGNKREQQKWTDFTKGVREFPAIRLHYIGVDSRYRGKGYGKYLLLEVINIAKEISMQCGCNFITAEVLGSSYWFYKKYKFVHLGYSGKFRKMALRFDQFYEDLT